jgi:hypothetical protein
MKKLLYIALILMTLVVIAVYKLPEKRTVNVALETEIPFDSCQHFFQNKSHWNHWHEAPSDIVNSAEGNDKLIVSKANNWGGYCTAQWIKKSCISNIESIENIELSSSDGGCNIQWESILICEFPFGRINGYFEERQRQAVMNNRLAVLDSLLKATYQTPPQTIDLEISIHEE